MTSRPLDFESSAYASSATSARPGGHRTAWRPGAVGRDAPVVPQARAGRRPPRAILAPPPLIRAATGRGVLDERGAGGRVVTDSRTARDPVAEAQGQGIDRALVEEALRGRLDAFNQLVARHQDHLFAQVYRLVPDRDQAADAVQEAFFSAYRNLESFRCGNVRSWLGRIAVNAAMDMQRARRRRPAQPYPEFEDDSWQPPAG